MNELPTKAELLDLLRRSTLAARSAAPKDSFDVSVYVSFILEFYMRAIGLAEGIHVLLNANLAQEANLLTRPLIEERLKLDELAAADESTRGGLVMGWQFHSLAEAEELFTHQAEVSSLGSPEQRQAVTEQVQLQRRRLQEYARRQGFKRQKFTKASLALRQYGDIGDYWNYALSQELVHGSGLTNSFRRSVRPDGVHQVAVFGSALYLVAGGVDVAGRSILRCCDAITRIMDWPSQPDVPSLTEEFARLEERIGKAGEWLVPGQA